MHNVLNQYHIRHTRPILTSIGSIAFESLTWRGAWMNSFFTYKPKFPLWEHTNHRGFDPRSLNWVLLVWESPVSTMPSLPSFCVIELQQSCCRARSADLRSSGFHTIIVALKPGRQETRLQSPYYSEHGAWWEFSSVDHAWWDRLCRRSLSQSVFERGNLGFPQWHRSLWCKDHPWRQSIHTPGASVDIGPIVVTVELSAWMALPYSGPISRGFIPKSKRYSHRRYSQRLR